MWFWLGEPWRSLLSFIGEGRKLLPQLHNLFSLAIGLCANIQPLKHSCKSLGICWVHSSSCRQTMFSAVQWCLSGRKPEWKLGPTVLIEFFVPDTGAALNKSLTSPVPLISYLDFDPRLQWPLLFGLYKPAVAKSLDMAVQWKTPIWLNVSTSFLQVMSDYPRLHSTRILLDQFSRNPLWSSICLSNFLPTEIPPCAMATSLLLPFCIKSCARAPFLGGLFSFLMLCF